jgi:hypothetical protein
MTGRVLDEALREGPLPAVAPVSHSTSISTNRDRSYTVTAYVSTVNGHGYLDYTEVTRSLPPRRPAVAR